MYAAVIGYNIAIIGAIFTIFPLHLGAVFVIIAMLSADVLQGHVGILANPLH